LDKKIYLINTQKLNFLKYNGRVLVEIIFQPFVCINVKKLDRQTDKKIEKNGKDEKINKNMTFCAFSEITEKDA
jgi:hypothetical protein